MWSLIYLFLSTHILPPHRGIRFSKRRVLNVESDIIALGVKSARTNGRLKKLKWTSDGNLNPYYLYYPDKRWLKFLSAVQVEGQQKHGIQTENRLRSQLSWICFERIGFLTSGEGNEYFYKNLIGNMRVKIKSFFPTLQTIIFFTSLWTFCHKSVPIF